MVLVDKIIVITGASSGIGEAATRRLAKAGAKVVIGARRTDRLEQLVSELGADNVICQKTDVTDKASVKALVDLAVERFGRVDVLYNNAGLMPLSPLAELKTDEWERMIDVNIKGVLFGIAAVLPIMIKQQAGHILVTDSVAGHVTQPGSAVYSGTKFAIQAIMEGLRQEQVDNHIRTTMISPGAVNTELYSTITDPEIHARVKANEQNNGLSAEAVAEAVAYAIDQPETVAINEILMRPSSQKH